LSASAGRPRGELVFGIVTLVLASVYYAMAAAIPRGALADGIGPGGLPKAYAAALAVLAIVLIVRGLFPGAPPIASAPEERVARRRDLPADPVQKPWRAGAMLAIGVAYAAAAGWVGYIPALAGLIFAAIYCQGGGRIPIRRGLVIAVAGAVLFWVLFVLVLRVPQPTAPAPGGVSSW
jgi:hypothetical protein